MADPTSLGLQIRGLEVNADTLNNIRSIVNNLSVIDSGGVNGVAIYSAPGQTEAATRAADLGLALLDNTERGAEKMGSEWIFYTRHKDTPRQFECTRLITVDQVKAVIRSIPGFATHAAEKQAAPRKDSGRSDRNSRLTGYRRGLAYRVEKSRTTPISVSARKNRPTRFRRRSSSAFKHTLYIYCAGSSQSRLFLNPMIS
jgi:hypothetical protein